MDFDASATATAVTALAGAGAGAAGVFFMGYRKWRHENTLVERLLSERDRAQQFARNANERRTTDAEAIARLQAQVASLERDKRGLLIRLEAGQHPPLPKEGWHDSP